MELSCKISNGILRVKVTPKASSNRIVVDGDVVRVYVTVAPENGKANKAVVKLLAKSIGVSKSSVVLIQGVASRDKVFRVTG